MSTIDNLPKADGNEENKTNTLEGNIETTISEDTVSDTRA